MVTKLKKKTIVTKLKNSNCNKTQNVRRKKLKNSKCDKTQIVTKLKNSNYDTTNATKSVRISDLVRIRTYALK